MRRKSYQLRSDRGTLNLEIQRIGNTTEGSALEVRTLDQLGNPNGSVIVHTWGEAVEKVHDLIGAALREGRI